MRLKYFRETSNWLHHNWYVLLKDLPDNKCDVMVDIMNNAADSENEEYCNTINDFIYQAKKMKYQNLKMQ